MWRKLFGEQNRLSAYMFSLLTIQTVFQKLDLDKKSLREGHRYFTPKYLACCMEQVHVMKNIATCACINSRFILLITERKGLSPARASIPNTSVYYQSTLITLVCLNHKVILALVYDTNQVIMRHAISMMILVVREYCPMKCFIFMIIL